MGISYSATASSAAPVTKSFLESLAVFSGAGPAGGSMGGNLFPSALVSMRESAQRLPRVPSASGRAAGATALVPSKDRHRPVPRAALAEAQSLQLPLEREPGQPRHCGEVLAPAQGVGKLSHLSPLPQL